MKKSVIALVIVCGVIAGSLIFLNRKNSSPIVRAPGIDPVAQQGEQPESGKVPPHRSAELPMVSDQPVEPVAMSIPRPAPPDAKPADAATELSRTVDALLSDKTSFSDRQALWKKLKAAGELDEAITELKQRATASPDDPAIPIAIGVGLMNKYPIADPDESAMTGLQMDQSFNKALKLDPANWEAQFLKATEMAYWPAEFNKGPEVIQRFSALIDQQDTMPAQPQFAQTYVMLGNQYQKAGQPDYAEQTWRLGLAKFPNDPTLQKKISGQ